MARTKVTSNGRVTIPKVIRDYLKLTPGDEVLFVIDEQRRRVTIEEMNEAITRNHTKARAKKR